MRLYCDCGRKIVVFKSKGNKTTICARSAGNPSGIPREKFQNTEG